MLRCSFVGLALGSICWLLVWPCRLRAAITFISKHTMSFLPSTRKKTSSDEGEVRNMGLETKLFQKPSHCCMQAFNPYDFCSRHVSQRMKTLFTFLRPEIIPNHEVGHETVANASVVGHDCISCLNVYQTQERPVRVSAMRIQQKLF
jgi:hypothetical protein